MINLIALARTDGNFHDKEKEILYKIGKKYALKKKQIDALLNSFEEVQVNIQADHNQWMEQLYDLCEMILADGVIEETEIRFCENLIQSMGYEKVLLAHLIDFVQLELNDPESWKCFKEEALVYKKKTELVNAI